MRIISLNRPAVSVNFLLILLALLGNHWMVPIGMEEPVLLFQVKQQVLAVGFVVEF